MDVEKNDIKISKIKVGITHGDINGISYEIILKAFRDQRMLEYFTPIIYGSPKVAAYYKKMLKISQVTFNHIKTAERADKHAVNIINCVSNKVRVELGQATKLAGEAALAALNAAIKDLKDGKIDILVTAPISKPSVYGDRFGFKGHTWFLAKEFGADDVLMLMVHDELRVGVVTDHIPLKQVADTITQEMILSKLRIFNQTLKTDFAIDGPLIAVMGLNPHAGDDGLIGDDEQQVIIPAIDKAKEEGINVLGPYAADGFFASGNYRNFDGILAMYHDQGLIPFKVLSQGQGVNYTAGLPIIRTSPDHGVAYNIAGLNKADHTSFVNALFLARSIYKNRQLFDNIEPLEKQDMKELMHTLKPANASEIQEVESMQQEDSADQVKQIDALKKVTLSSSEIENDNNDEKEEPAVSAKSETEQYEEKIEVALPPEEDIITDETTETQIDEPVEMDRESKQVETENEKEEKNSHHNHHHLHKFPFHRDRENFRDYSDLT